MRLAAGLVPAPPGVRAGVLAYLAAADADVVHIEHGRTSGSVPVDEVEIAVTVEAKGSAHCDEILRMLHDKGYSFELG